MKTITYMLTMLFCIGSLSISSQNCTLSPTQIEAFGSATIDGNTAMIAGDNEVRIYTESSDVWTLVQILPNPDTNAINFGQKIDLSGDFAIVSALEKAYILEKNNGLWNVAQLLLHNDQSYNSQFGYNVKIDGTTAIVSAIYDSDINPGEGAVFIYEYDGTSWNQIEKLTPTSPSNYINFGQYVDLSDGKVAVIDRGYDSFFSNIGAILIFEDDGASNWNLEQVIEQEQYTYIYGIALDGITLVTSSYSITNIYEDNGTTQYSIVQTLDGISEIGSVEDVNGTRMTFYNELFDYDSTLSEWVSVQEGYYSNAELSGDFMITPEGKFYTCNTNLCYASLGNYGNNYIYLCSGGTDTFSYNVDIGGGTGPFTIEFDTDNDGITDDTRTGIARDSILEFTATDSTVIKLVQVFDEGNANFMCTTSDSLEVFYNQTPDLVPMGTISNTCPDDFIDLTYLSYTDNNPTTANDTNAIYQYKDMEGYLLNDPTMVCEPGFVVIEKYSNGCFDRDTVTIDILDCGNPNCQLRLSQSLFDTEMSSTVMSVDRSDSLMIIGSHAGSSSNGGTAFLYELVANGTWTVLDTFYPTEGASSGTVGDNFGYAVSIDGDYMAIGAYGDDDVGGAVYIYEKTAGVFNQVDKILNSGQFGYSLDLTDDQLIVGTSAYSGFKAYVYKRDNTGNWNETQQIIPPNPYSPRYFSQELEYENGTLVFNARGFYNNDSLYVFTDDGTGTFLHSASIPSPTTSNYSSFGNRISYSNDRIAATMTGTNEKAVYIFENDGSGNWNTMDTIFLTPVYNNDVELKDDTLFASQFNQLFKYIYNGTDWVNEKTYTTITETSGIHYENNSLLVVGRGTTEYYTCEDLTCYAYFYRNSYTLNPIYNICESYYSGYNINLKVDVLSGIGPYTLEIDSTSDGTTDWTINNYHPGESISIMATHPDTFNYDLISVIDESNGNEICNLGANATVILNANPDLVDISDQVNVCPNNFVDLTAITLTDNNPYASNFEAVYSYYSPTNGTISDPENITSDGVYRITKQIGNCSDYVEFVVDINNCPGELCPLVESGLFYPDSTLYNYEFGRKIDFDGNRVIGSSKVTSTEYAHIFELDVNNNFVFMDSLYTSDTYESQFGNNVAISGDYAAVADHYNTENGSLSGAVFIFKFDSGTGLWNEEAKLIGSNVGYNSRFGTALAMDGDRLAVSTLNGQEIYIFERNTSGIWNEVAIASPSTTTANFSFGFEIDLDGNYLAVGDRFNNNMASQGGAVFIFEHDGSNNWTEYQVIYSSDIAAQDYFGYDLDLNGDKLIVGAYGDDDKGTLSGSAYIFEKTASTTFSEVQKIIADDGISYDNFGRTLSIDGDRVVITNFRRDSYIYEYDGSSTWNFAKSYFH